ncbi:PAS domain-containing protein [Sorangium sp. So ce131]|uniref:PAS domain-containing protein n=1 Tax=Sorangium sp. So ce131 TaxID=3133282 RepID=UPI003F62D2D9
MSANEALRRRNAQLRRQLDELRHRMSQRARQGGAEPAAQERPGSVDHDACQLREDALLGAVELLRAVMDAAPILLFVKDTEGRYILANKHFMRWAGLEWDQIEGKTDYDLFPKYLAETFQSSDLELLKTGQPAEWEESYPMPDGQLHHYVTTKFLVRDEQGNIRGVCGISTDVTSYKRAEAESGRR